MGRFCLLLPFTSFLFSGLAPTLVNAQSAQQVLVANGHNEFAAFLEQHPGPNTNDQDHTIWAPTDQAMKDLYNDPDYQKSSKRKRAIILASYISENQQFADISPPPGTTFSQINQTGDVVTTGVGGGLAQAKIVEPRPQGPINKLARRLTEGSLERPEPDIWAAKYYAGNGQTAFVIREGLKFDKGIIHLTDKIFTPSNDIREGIVKSGLGIYEAIFNRVPGYWSVVVNNPRISVILASPDAVKNAGDITDAQWAAILDYGTITTGFVAYTPKLEHGKTYKTRGGYFAVTVYKGNWYINDAKIVGKNYILNNGVIQVIDKILYPPKPDATTVPGPDGMVITLDKKAADEAAGTSGPPSGPYPPPNGPGPDQGNGTRPSASANITTPPPPIQTNPSGAQSLMANNAWGILAGLTVIVGVHLML